MNNTLFLLILCDIKTYLIISNVLQGKYVILVYEVYKLERVAQLQWDIVQVRLNKGEK